MTSKDQRGIYLHIPKTGGNTIHEILIRQYGKKQIIHIKNNREANKLLENPIFKSNKFKLLTGHMAFGHHTKFKFPNEVTYFTMMRDPIKRVTSYYNYILKIKEHYLHDEVVKNNYSLKDFIESGIDVHTENNQIRLLSNNIETPHGECQESMIEVAKDNILKHFSVVGINEMFDESLLCLKTYYGWKTPLYTKVNVNKSYKKPISVLDDSTLNTIKKYNSLDIALYDWAKIRLEHLVAEQGHDFQKSLTQFRRINKIVQTVVPVKNKIIGRKRK